MKHAIRSLVQILAVASLAVSGGVSAATIIVDDSGGADHTTIQAGIDAAAPGDTVQINDGNYFPTSTILVNKENLTISGESETGVVIDGDGLPNGAWTVLIDTGANSLILENVTITDNDTTNPNGGPKDGLKANFVTNLTLSSVTVINSASSEIDLNNVVGVTFMNVTANGNDTPGVGIALSGVKFAVLDTVHTQGNQWGGVGLFDVNTSVSAPPGWTLLKDTGNVTVVSNSTLTEPNPLYSDQGFGGVLGDLFAAEFNFAVQNPDFRDGFDGRGEDFVFFQRTRSDAVAAALGLPFPQSSTVQSLDKDGAGEIDLGLTFFVDNPDSNPNAPMSIGAAANQAPSGATILVAAGTFTPDAPIVVADSNVTVTGDAQQDVIIDGTNLSSGAMVQVLLSADNVTLEQFTLQNGPSGLSAGSSSGLNVSNVTIQNIGANGGATFGILLDGATDATISNNTISNVGEDNFARHSAQGIYLLDAVSTITLSGNTINGVGNELTTSSNKGIYIGDSNSEDAATVVITGNTITNVFSNNESFADGGRGAYGILVNHKVTGLDISNNIITNLSGLWVHGIGLEGATPSAQVNGNTLIDLFATKGDTQEVNAFEDEAGIFFQVNPDAESISTNCNSFENMAFGMLLHPDQTVSSNVDASGNWWGDQSGPTNASNQGGLGVGVGDNFDFSPWSADAVCSGTLYAIPTKLVFTVQPVGSLEDTELSTQPVVQAQDSDGNLGINFSGDVTLSLDLSSGGLSGTNPVAAVNGEASFSDLVVAEPGTYTLGTSNSASLTDTNSVSFVVTDNQAPTADPQSVATNEDTLVNITLTGSDPEDDSLTFSVETQPGNGVLSGTAPSLTYTPDADFNGTDSFDFKVCDDAIPQGCDTATVNITVTPVNDAPVANPDSYSTDEDTILPVDAASGVLANDTNVDGDMLSALLVSGPSNAQSFTLNNDGSFSYTPAADFNGTDEFVYEVSDGNVVSGQATVSITVNAVNDAPVAVSPMLSTPEDTSLDITVTGSDVDGDPLTFSVISFPSDGSLSGVAPDYTYAPNDEFSGTDSFDFEVCDDATPQLCDTGTVTINVGVVNDAPVASADSYQVNEDRQLIVEEPGVLFNDSDSENDTLTASLINDVLHGTLNLSADGSFDYTPDSNYNGIDSFVYEVSDGSGGTDQATVTITITPQDEEGCIFDESYVTVANAVIKTDQNFEACIGIIFGPNVRIESISDVEARAGQYVKITDSFSVEQGSTFAIRIDPDAGGSSQAAKIVVPGK